MEFVSEKNVIKNSKILVREKIFSPSQTRRQVSATEIGPMFRIGINWFKTLLHKVMTNDIRPSPTRT